MLISMLSADFLRARRAPELLLAPLVVLLASIYGGFSLYASISGNSAPAFVLLTPGSGIVSLSSAPSITAAIGATCLSGGLVPVVSSVAVAYFLHRGIASGHAGGLVASGAGRRKILAEAFVISALTSLTLLAVGSAPYLACYAFGWIHTSLPTGADVGAIWFSLALLHSTFYSFMAGCLVLLARRLWAGVVSAALLSSGAADMLVSAALGVAGPGFSVAGTIRLLLPDSIMEALCADVLDLTAKYVGGASLLVSAALTYLVLIAIVVAAGIAPVGRCGLLCRCSS
ncbi:hypothetical protein [Paratractidigestivibacter sp.]|uniref:hypothetical protein n=2 Tax=Paratractidigestivibacter sp. TaxID=2847316 RepID=UPI002ACB0D48|nr:hypothetical protein [Paratractidigestivibacter sp.]